MLYFAIASLSMSFPFPPAPVSCFLAFILTISSFSAEPELSERDTEERKWFSNPAPAVKPSGSGVLKYLNATKKSNSSAPLPDAVDALPEYTKAKEKKKKKTAGFGDFSGW